MRHRIATSTGVALTVLAAACAAAGGRPSDTVQRAADVPVDSLGPLLRSRFGLRPVTVDVRQGQRVSIGLATAPWTDSAATVRFDRAYDIARLVWDRYGAGTGVDTVSVREVSITGEVRRTEEYFFYPRQLTSRERPHFRATR
jgi:hypothetical protein